MSHEVYANGRCIAAKSGSGTSPAAFPDTCFTPPQTPATPPGAPVPYPNTASEGDTSEGSRSVLIVGKEVMLKNQSYYATSTGDEAGCAPQKGVVSTVNRGKCYFVAWSMDVVFEGLEVCRHLDLTTHNHASPTANTPPFPNLSAVYVNPKDCPTILDKEEIALHRHGDKETVCDGQDSDHVMQNAYFENVRGESQISTAKGYSTDDAPCICMEGPSTDAATPHGVKTGLERDFAADLREDDYQNVTYQAARDKSIENFALSADSRPSDKALKCIQIALDEYYKKQLGINDNTPLRVPRTGKFRANRNCYCGP
jgi:hypothetical protein